MSHALNKFVFTANLEDVKEEIEKLLVDIDGDIDDEELRNRFEHMQHHLNWAWNGRHLPPDYVHTDGLFKRFSQHPKDLVPFGST